MLSPEAIAGDAGVSPATFYTYFSSKDAVLAASFDAALSSMTRDMEEVLSIEALLDNGLEATVHDLVRRVVRGFAHDARIFRLTISRIPESEAVREVYRHHEDEILRLLERFLRRGMAAGRLRQADPQILAGAMLVTIQGFQNPFLVRSGTTPVTDELAAMLVGLLRPS